MQQLTNIQKKLTSCDVPVKISLRKSHCICKKKETRIKPEKNKVHAGNLRGPDLVESFYLRFPSQAKGHCLFLSHLNPVETH